MAYRFQAGAPVPDEIKRVAREEIAAAVRQLSGQGETGRDAAIHEARKSVKKIRGALRLIQPEMGDVFPLENALFRDIGRQLSQFRDAGAILETFDALRREYREKLDARAWAAIRRRLLAGKRLAEKQGDIDVVLAGTAGALQRAAARVGVWPLFADGFAAIAQGLEATFRRGQKAMARAHKYARPENFHDWRKRVKEHWYHIRLLEDFWDPALTAYEKTLKELETALGEDHNLVVLEEKVKNEPAFDPRQPEIRQFLRAIAKYRRALREKAFALGEEIYGEKPGRLMRRVKRQWPKPAVPVKSAVQATPAV